MEVQFNRKRHGGLFDRGAADSYYNRSPEPHWYPHPNGTGHGERKTDLTEAEAAEYMAGYEHNENFGEKKSYE